MTARFTFAVGFTTVRPVVPDQWTSFVVLDEEDSVAGARRAEWTAVAMVSGIHRAEMVTSTQLLGAEL